MCSVPRNRCDFYRASESKYAIVYGDRSDGAPTTVVIAALVAAFVIIVVAAIAYGRK